MEAGRFYLHDEAAALRLEVRGRLDGELVDQMLASLATARSILQGRTLVFDLRRAGAIEPEAAGKLAELRGDGVRFLAREEDLGSLAGALPREPRLVWQSRFGFFRQIWCGALRLLRPGCACASCRPERVWSL